MSINKDKEKFSKRHIGLTTEDKNYLLSKIGYKNMDDFIQDVVPSNIKRQSPMNINIELSEQELLSKIKDYASLNKKNISMLFTGIRYFSH